MKLNKRFTLRKIILVCDEADIPIVWPRFDGCEVNIEYGLIQEPPSDLFSSRMPDIRESGQRRITIKAWMGCKSYENFEPIIGR